VDIAPDTKDWTWVLDRPCPECGLDTRQVQPRDVAAMIRANAEAWTEVLSTRLGVSRRSSPHMWSTLEYACHVRDVFRLYDVRLLLMLNEDDPLFPNWDQDQTAVDDRYGVQDPATVSTELGDAADRLAEHFDEVGDEQWSRTGRRSDGAAFRIDTFSRYLIHDPIHHLYDVTRSGAAGG
jgi:DinB superfamily